MLRNCCGPAPIYFTASASIPALDIGSAKSWCLPSSCPRPHARKQGRLEISDARASRTSELLAATCTAMVQRWVQQELCDERTARQCGGEGRAAVEGTNLAGSCLRGETTCSGAALVCRCRYGGVQGRCAALECGATGVVDVAGRGLWRRFVLMRGPGTCQAGGCSCGFSVQLLDHLSPSTASSNPRPGQLTRSANYSARAAHHERPLRRPPLATRSVCCRTVPAVTRRF